MVSSMQKAPAPVRHGRRPCRLLIGLACVGLWGVPFAWGQDDWETAEVAAAVPAAEVAQALQVQAQVDRWLFGNKTRSQVERSIMSRCSLQLDGLESVCDLSDAQRAKLELAARGDMRRFFRQSDEIRERFGNVVQDQQKLSELMQAVQPLRSRIGSSSFFDSTSLLHKVLLRTLEPEQARRYQEQHLQRLRFQYEARIEMTLVMLESGIPLRQEQRQQFAALLLSETQPPASFGRQAFYAVLFKASQVDQAKLEPIFDAEQWRSLRMMLAQAERMEPSLKANGFVP